MAKDPNYEITNRGEITGIKSIGILVPTGDCIKQEIPAILTQLKDCPDYVQKYGQSAFGEYVFVGCEPVGRVSGDYTKFNFAFVGDMDQFERDPITNDHWMVIKVISTAQDLDENPGAETIGILKVSEEIGTGVFVNQTKVVTIPGRLQTVRRNSQELGLIITTYQYVSTAAGVAGTGALGLMIENEFKPLNDYFGLLTRSTIAASSKTDIEFDPETGCKITTTRAISETALTSQAPGTEVTSKQISPGLYLNVTRSIDMDCLANGYSLMNFVPFEVPRILYGIDFAVGTDGLSLTLNPLFRGGYFKQIAGTLDVSFHETEPARGTLYQIIPRRVQYNGTYFDVPFGDMITDEWVNVGSAGGTFVELVSWDASTPSATQYAADIGDPQLWAEKTTRWRFQLYRREQQIIILE